MKTRGRVAGAIVLLASLCVAAPSIADDDAVAAAVDLYQQGKYAEAETALRSAEGSEAAAFLAATLAKEKKYDEAVTAAKAALLKAPNHDVAVGALGEALVGLKKYDEAVTKLSAVIKDKADVPYAYYWRGQAYYNTKQTARMISDYEMFVKLAPKYPEAESVKQLLAALK